jgi:hypothetical protein
MPKAKLGGALVEAWRSASLIKKITFFLLPLDIVAVLLPESEPPPGPDASARAVPSSSGSASAMARTAKSVGAASVAMPSAAGASASASAVALQTKAPSDAKPTAAAGSASSEPAGTPAVSADATERAAIDAAFAGRWPVAVRLYDGLAESHPDQPAFREAARILRETKTHTPK